MTDLPQPPPIPPGWKDWGPLEQRAHDLEMRYWEYRRACAMVGDEPIGRDEYLAHIEAEEAREHHQDGLARWRVDWAQLWAAPEAPQYLLEPLIAAGRAHSLYAGAKTGKSYLMLPAAAALATGKAFLYQPAGEPVDVVYMDYEMTEADLVDRLTEFGYGPEDDLSHLHYILLPTIPPLNTSEGGAYVHQYVQDVGAQLVVVDTTSRAVKGKENDPEPFQDFYRYTGMQLKAMGCAWVRLDHAGKDLERGTRGSSAKTDDVDVVWQMVRKDQGVELTATHKRPTWVPEKIDLALTEEDGTKRWSAADRLWPAGTAEVSRELDRLEVPLGATQRAARAALKAAGGKATEAVLRAALKWRREGVMPDLEVRRGVRRGGFGDVAGNDNVANVVPIKGQVRGSSQNSSRVVADSGPTGGADVSIDTSRAVDATRPEDDQVIPGPWVDQTGLFS